MNFLVEHARDNVWCEPRQDMYYTFKPHRVSAHLGAIGRVVISWYQVNLPTPRIDRYHVYNIGKIADQMLGLELERGVWVKVSDLMVANRALIDVYLTNGAVVPKDQCYLTILKDYTVILAVKITNADLGTHRYIEPHTNIMTEVPYRVNSQDLFIRFYRNMRFSTPSWQAVAGDMLFPIRHVSRLIVTLGDYTQFMGEVGAINSQFGASGAGLYFKDGFVETLPTLYTLDLVGRTLSYVYDDSIKSIQFHKFTGLKSFDSVRDPGKSKYIILSTQDYDTIDYIDDVDFYLVSRNPSTNRYRGVMINRYIKDAMRMLTHNAWSLNADYLTYLINEHQFNTQLEQVEVMVVVRQGALIRGLTHQNNRIEELYRLGRAKRLAIMSGTVAAPEEWHARELENSDYVKLMGVPVTGIDLDLVMSAYGYNGVTVVAEPVFHDVSDLDVNRHVPMHGALMLEGPDGLGARAVFCYNQQRELIHYYTNTALDVVEILPTPQADDADVIEVFHARISETGDGTHYDTDIESHDLKFWGYRCYVCPVVDDVPTEEWTDVTGGVYYNYSEDPITGMPKISWNWGLLNNANMFPAVRINGTIHIHKPTMPASDVAYDGILKFTVGSSPLWFGNQYLRPMTIAPAVCDIYMDNRLLIRDLDYYMQWPYFVITRRPAGNIEDTEILIRTYGCCDADAMEPYHAREVGFVRGGVLSVDQRFDVRNDRNVKVNIAGRLYHRSEVRFSEDETGADVTDGLPYIVEDYITPIEPYTGYNTVTERAKSFAIDQKVADYLTTELLGDDPGDHTVVYERWRVFSPFLNAIIHEMRHGSYFNDAALDFRYGNAEVDLWVAPYLYLLDFDPAVQGFNDQYVVVYPHLYLEPVEVSTIQFTFLKYLIRNYLHDNVELSQSVNIGS